MAELENLVGKKLLLVDNFGLSLPPLIDLIVAHSPIREQDIFSSTQLPDDWLSYQNQGVSLAIIHTPDYRQSAAEKIIAGANLGIAMVVLLRQNLLQEHYASVKMILDAGIPTIVRGYGFSYYQQALETLNQLQKFPEL